MQPEQILYVTEILKPGAEEIAAMLPVGLGRRILRWSARGGSFPLLGCGLRVTTTSITGFALMRILARFKSIRRRSLRYQEEQAGIERWLEAMCRALRCAPEFAAALAELPRLLKGYGETHARGRRNYATIFEHVVGAAIATGSEAHAAPLLREATAAALADPEADALGHLIANASKSVLSAEKSSAPIHAQLS
jgi:indolepyruvate ferredoxin oxidoreductase beta subunit